MASNRATDYAWFDDVALVTRSTIPLTAPTARLGHDANDWIISVPSEDDHSYQIRTATDLAADPSTWETAGSPQSGQAGITLEFRLPKMSWPANTERFFVIDVSPL